VWGPSPQSVGRYQYYVSFIDDFSKFTWIYLLRNRSEVFQVFLNFQQHVERLFNRKIITIQTDWGGEYQKLNSFFQKIGIVHHVSCPHAHQQNGSAERKHRHIVEVGLSLLAQASMPLKFWDEAFLAATYSSIELLVELLIFLHLCIVSSMTNQTILFFAFLAALVGRIFVPIINTNFSFAPNNVLFLATVIFIKDTSA